MSASPRLLLGCYDTPGWGGASTFSYTLFEQMQRDGHSVAYVNLLKDLDEPWLRATFGHDFGNPRSLDHVQTCILDADLWQVHPGLVDLIQTMKPDLLVACRFATAWLMKRAAPHIPLAFITSGCWQIKRLIRDNAIGDFVRLRRSIVRGISFDIPKGDKEREAVEASDLIIVHSPHVRFAFEHFYPAHMGKVHAHLISIADCVYAEAERFSSLALPFAERDIDVIFVASTWRRHEKNYDLLRRIATDAGGLKIHVVGDFDRDHLPVQHHGVVARREDLYALLGRAKAIACPSRWDPAPGVLFEASAMGCNVVASENCGNWRLCNEQLLAEANSATAFLECLARATTVPFADNRQLFRGGYADLVETLSALSTSA